MIARHTITYVGSRAVAAALNMASLAAFTRLAPVEIYGTYLFILSWAIVLYGATCQWPKFAFFALYEDERAAGQIGTLLRLLLGGLILAAIATGTAVALGLVVPGVAVAIVAAATGMTIYEGANEIARTRLAAEAVALSVVSRAVLVIGLGSTALVATCDPVDLVLAVALANMLAAIPAILAVWPAIAGGHGSRLEAQRLLAYGWPLVLSFGIAALAQTVDRLIIGKTIGTEELGAYGAIGDFLRQSFVVFGESIALSMISIAKRDARDGGMEAARPVLKDAARALTFIAAFGAVFFLTFDDLIVSVLLGPAFRGPALALAPILIVASICMLFRAYYFGQVIYFAGSSRLDAMASLVLLVVVAFLTAMLIPEYGTKGAAIAVAVGQGLACLVFIIGAKGRIRMPVPILDILQIVLCALGTGAILTTVDLLPGSNSPVAIAGQIAILCIGAGAAAWHFNIIGIADGLTRWSRRAA